LLARLALAAAFFFALTAASFCAAVVFFRDLGRDRRLFNPD
jgi:hypothetical protein